MKISLKKINRVERNKKSKNEINKLMQQYITKHTIDYIFNNNEENN